MLGKRRNVIFIARQFHFRVWKFALCSLSNLIDENPCNEDVRHISIGHAAMKRFWSLLRPDRGIL